MAETLKIPRMLSWSSVSTYSECSLKWLLGRGYHLDRTTWYATLGGTAVHEITEAMDRAEAKGIPLDKQIDYAPSFESVFMREVAEAEAKGLEIRVSGRKTNALTLSGGPNKKDVDWWLHWGPIFIQKWIEWKRVKGWQIATLPDGQLGIEVKIQLELPNGVSYIGYVDRVYMLPSGDVVVVDLKTGVSANELQLATYALGIREQYGLDVEWGAFWKPTSADDTGNLILMEVPKWDLDKVARMYLDAERGIRAGIFLPNATDRCSTCPVVDYCWAKAGEKSKEVPMVTEILDQKTGEVIPL